MVTKGYRKGVYDRVTEGTWELEPVRESVAGSPVASKSVSHLRHKGPASLRNSYNAEGAENARRVRRTAEE
jgi:hypothetical protein